MKIELSHGNGKLHGELPCAAPILQPLAVPPAGCAEALICKALAAPIGGPSLGDSFGANDRVVIVTSDIAIPGADIYLPLLVEQLNRCGIVGSQISVLIARGIHRSQTEEEHRKFVGSLFGRVAVFDHDCDDEDQLVALGMTTAAIPVSLNRRVVEADPVIVTGTAGSHYFAGFDAETCAGWGWRRPTVCSRRSIWCWEDCQSTLKLRLSRMAGWCFRELNGKV